MERPTIDKETFEEEIDQTLDYTHQFCQKAGQKTQKDILWSGGRSVKEAYSQTASLYSDLANSLEDFVSGLPEGGLNISDKYREVSLYSRIISDYYRQKSDKVSVDGGLVERVHTPGWETLRVLYDLPSEILSETKQDLQDGRVSPVSGIAIQIIREVGKMIRDYLPTLTPEEVEYTIFPESPSMEEREDYIIQDRIAVLRVFLMSREQDREVVDIWGMASKDLKKELNGYKETAEIVQTFSRYRKELQGNISMQEAQWRYYNSKELLAEMFRLLEGKNQYYRIVKIDGETRIIETRFIEYKPQIPETAIEALRDLAQIQKSSKVGQIRISKDLLETEIVSRGDTLSLIRENTSLSDKEKEETIKHIQKLQKKGKLLRGSMEGLSGGVPYFKIFTIALAQTLNEQIKFYQTEETGSGLPLELAEKYIGKGKNKEVKLLTEKQLPIFKKGGFEGMEKRYYPYILISYEDLAKKTKGTDKISGGKETEYIKDYIEELQNKEYLLPDGRGGLIGLPFIHREVSLYLEKNGKEVGCILRLSPQFSKTIRGYSALRADTIKLLGGGKQKEITMNLLDILIFSRGIGSEYRKVKEELLSQIGTNKRYERSKKEREKDFKEAIQKVKDSQIITKYKEEKNPGGEIISVFIYNPDYFKGTEVSEIEDQ